MNKHSIEEILDEYFISGIDSFLPHVSINMMVLAYEHPYLKVLVQRMPGEKLWMLPGGYIKNKEDMDDAAYRNLKLSGINNVFLRQIKTFGAAHRIPEYHATNGNHSSRYNEIMKWASSRFVTVVYYGLVNYSKTKIVNGGISAESKWMDVTKLDSMAVDHSAIIDETLKIIPLELLNYPIAMNLLPETFTLNELRGLYEVLLNRSIDRGTFRRKILGQRIIEKTDIQKDRKGRPSDIFRFRKEAYLLSLKEEAKFGF